MHQASVGFHCPECVRNGKQVVRTMATLGVVREPIVTQVLIGLNVLVFLLGLTKGGTLFRVSNELLRDYALFGGILPGIPLGVDAGEWYRVFTSAFLHDGIIHLGMNMFLLWVLGSQLERREGHLELGLVYLAAVIGGAAGALLLEPTTPTVGASGGVFGLMGMMVVHQRSRGIDVWQSGVGGLIVINLVLSVSLSNISLGGHVGGLLGGLAAAALFAAVARQRRPRWNGVAAVAALSLLLFGVALVAAAQWRDPFF
jgi:membrane associated rhomboid family serine protease